MLPVNQTLIPGKHLPDAPLFVMVAGEASGDQLGAALMVALRTHYPDARFAGIGGEKMQALGFEAWWDSESLAVMGLSEVLRHLPRLFRLRRELRQKILAAQPQILIGIDAPDFNLGLEKQVRSHGILTAHYVSPTVWAWRQWRVKKIAAAANRVLCLFPFEPQFYESRGVAASYTGHPMADAIALENGATEARQSLGLPVDGLYIGLLPGSRRAEVEMLAGDLLDAAELITEKHPHARFLVPLAGRQSRAGLESELARRTLPQVQLFDGRSLDVMAAADVVVCASGTASLECMLVGRPMVVIYRMTAVSHFLLATMGMFKAPFFALPNILSGKELVPELVQDGVNGPSIAQEVENWLDDPQRYQQVCREFLQLHRQLSIDAAASAAKEIAAMVEAGHDPVAASD